MAGLSHCWLIPSNKTAPQKEHGGRKLLSCLRVLGCTLCSATTAQQTPEGGWDRVPPGVSQEVQDLKAEQGSSHKPRTRMNALPLEENTTALFTNRCVEAGKKL